MLGSWSPLVSVCFMSLKSNIFRTASSSLSRLAFESTCTTVLVLTLIFSSSFFFALSSLFACLANLAVFISPSSSKFSSPDSVISVWDPSVPFSCLFSALLASSLSSSVPCSLSGTLLFASFFRFFSAFMSSFFFCSFFSLILLQMIA